MATSVHWYRQLFEQNRVTNTWRLIEQGQQAPGVVVSDTLEARARSKQLYYLERFWWWDGATWILWFGWLYQPSGQAPRWVNYE